MTGDRIQCNLSAFHVTRLASVDFVTQGAFLKLSVNSNLHFEQNSRELFTGRQGCLRCDADRFRQEFYFSAVLHGDRREEDFGRKASEQCDFSYLPVVKCKMGLTSLHDSYGS